MIFMSLFNYCKFEHVFLMLSITVCCLHNVFYTSLTCSDLTTDPYNVELPISCLCITAEVQ